MMRAVIGADDEETPLARRSDLDGEKMACSNHACAANAKQRRE
jgi:hypothetical protein